jgi:CBS-domain-containing membrane protein
VFSSLGSDIVLDALQEMSRHGLSSVAVVDDRDRLVGNLSMTDIKYLFKSGDMALLWCNCLTFISEALSESGLEQGRVSSEISGVADHA